MAYVKQTWTDGTAGGTPISADRLTHIEDGIFDAGGFPVRQSTTVTTSSIPAGTSVAAVVTLAIGFRLYTIRTSSPARVRVYQTDGARIADLARGVGTAPASDAGVTLEYVTTDTAIHWLSPLVDGVNLEDIPVADIPLTVTNNGATGTVDVTFTWIRSE